MISEIDMNDWKADYVRCEIPVKLYDVPRGSIVTIDTMDSSDLPIHFSHLDGMYSFCTIIGTNDVCHLPAWESVFVWSKK